MNVDASGCARKVIDVHGAAGVEWLDRLPAIIAGCAQRWSLTILPPFEDLSYNYVTPALREDGTPVVLKAGVPHRELLGEMEALRVFSGEGAVRLLEADPDQGVLLLGRVAPGTPLSDLADDRQVTQIAADVLRRLWKPAQPERPFIMVARWAKGLERLHARFDGGYGPFPPVLVDRAERLFTDLLNSDSEMVLLHGDIHPANILKSERDGWLAIDPKGVVGDRLYDVATFLNGLSRWRRESRTQDDLERQVNQVVETFGVDREQVLGWGLAQIVLSGWWSYEDHGRGWEPAFALAELYASLLYRTQINAD